MSTMIEVAISQHAPVYLNLEQTLEKAFSIMDDATGQGCELLVFGETWLTGYPVWLDYVPAAALWDHEPTKEVFAQMHQHAVTVPGPHIDLIKQRARELSLNVCLGINEKVIGAAGHGTLYNSFVIIDSRGELVLHHRKLMPTFTEKMLYGLGDGRGIGTVQVNEWNLGGLICWEHWMPLSRQALHNQGEQIHVALWPKVHEMHEIASRHYAFEGRCYVLAAGQIIRSGQIPDVLELPDEMVSHPEQLLLNGGSCIIGPDGKYLVPPVFDEERLIIATLDLNKIKQEQMTLDVSGHYSRPDIYEFNVKK